MISCFKYIIFLYNISLSLILLQCVSQVREAILQRCKEVEQTAIEQATDNAILDQLSKVSCLLQMQFSLHFLLFFYSLEVPHVVVQKAKMGVIVSSCLDRQSILL